MYKKKNILKLGIARGKLFNFSYKTAWFINSGFYVSAQKNCKLRAKTFQTCFKHSTQHEQEFGKKTIKFSIFWPYSAIYFWTLCKKTLIREENSLELRQNYKLHVQGHFKEKFRQTGFFLVASEKIIRQAGV